MVQRAAVGAAPVTAVPPIAHEVLGSPGQPLDAGTRAFMEPRFGHDFSQVRVHSDANAAESARAVNALAYTVGGDVVFGTGQYSPGTSEGRRFLAHELTHVVQQASRSVVSMPVSENLLISEPSDSLERAAHQIATTVVSGQRGSIQGQQESLSMRGSSGRSLPLIQRQEVPGSPDLTLEPSPFTARLIGSLTIDGFAPEKADLTSQHKSQLRKLASMILLLLSSYSTSSVTLIGHADATGTEAYNIPLSKERAEAVRSFLKLEHVPEEVMSTDGVGSSVLRVETMRPEPRNRRVDIIFEPRKGTYKLTAPGPIPELPLSRPSLVLPPTYSLPEIPEFLKPPPPPVQRPGISLEEKLWEPVDSALKPLLRKSDLPSWVQDLLLNAAHAAASKGITSPFNAEVDQTNLGDREKEALKKAFEEGLLKSKFKF